MFWRTLCAFALLASTAAAQPDPPSEIVVRDGDYYETLRDTGHPVRITGGRIDNLLGFGGGSKVTIEGGSIGTIRSGGNLELYLRGGGFQIDNPVLYDDGPMGDSDVIFLYLEDVYTYAGRPTASGGYGYSVWFPGPSYGEVAFADNPMTAGHDYPIDFSTFSPLFPGDTTRDGLVDLDDLNSVRNNFATTGDGGSAGDTDADGDVDLDDLNNVRNNFGVDYLRGSNPVPEPATTTLLLIQTTALSLLALWRQPSILGRLRNPARNS